MLPTKGRALYDQMGFVQNNEMRFSGRLDIPVVN